CEPTSAASRSPSSPRTRRSAGSTSGGEASFESTPSGRADRPGGARAGRVKVTLLAGGTGAAKLAVGLQAELGPGELTVISNTADDDDFWGLRVCPDTDSVLFRLAGIFNEEAGFGVAEETFNVHGQMARLGELDWFWLGDRDLAFH